MIKKIIIEIEDKEISLSIEQLKKLKQDIDSILVSKQEVVHITQQYKPFDDFQKPYYKELFPPYIVSCQGKI